MAQIEKQFRFEAAHQLPGHSGKCRDLHGHSYVLTIILLGPIKEVQLSAGCFSSDSGMVEDFDVLSRIVKPLIEEHCDHKFLNDTLPVERTTAELIACWFFGEVSEGLRRLGIANTTVYSVKVQETATSAATVFHDDWVAAGRPAGPRATDQ
jgi:6-pyruvoyltetrahydropterin/6-carboxytetrahydropterin synthase